MIRRILPGILCVVLAGGIVAACETATAYRPAARPGGVGYSDQQLAHNRYRITFNGNSATPRDQVENYLLRRAAEVTLSAGYRNFVFDTRDTKTKTTYFTPFTPWPGARPYYGWYWHSWAYDQPEAYPVTRYQAYAEIVMLTDEEAAKDPHSLNANDVLAHVGPQSAPPAPHGGS